MTRSPVTRDASEELRPLLFGIAYRMVGTVGDAEDIVQETLLRLHRARGERADIGSPKAFASAVATRLAIDHLRSARVRRERYVGSWLPEPLVAATAEDAAAQVERADSLSLAFLVVLERLSPLERAVFLLRDVFDYDYEEIARIVERRPDNCRQLAARARRRLDEGRPRFDVPAPRRDELARRLLAAMQEGETGALEELLAADVVFDGDGGGKAPAVPAPVRGRRKVAALLRGFARVGERRRMAVEQRTVNGTPGIVVRDADGRVLTVMAFDVGDRGLRAIYSIVNPDKLRHVGPVGDLAAALDRRD